MSKDNVLTFGFRVRVIIFQLGPELNLMNTNKQYEWWIETLVALHIKYLSPFVHVSLFFNVMPFRCYNHQGIRLVYGLTIIAFEKLRT